VCTENLNADVMVMKSAKDRVWTNGPEPLNRARDGRILVQRPVCPDVVIIATIGAQDAAQMYLAQDNEIVQAFAPDRTNQSFGISVLPGRGWRRRPIAYPHCLDSAGDDGAIDPVPIAD
jgi:hypothetical protein